MAADAANVSAQAVWVWGLPLAPLTFEQTLERIDALIKAGVPSFFITANLHYAMLTAQDARLGKVNQEANFILADGMPLVWASRWRPQRLPERVAGSDLVPALCERAAGRGYRGFLMGGAPGVAATVAEKMCARFPQLQMAGVEVPPFRSLSAEEQTQLVARIRAARPDLLFVAFGQPKGELWLAEHCRELGVPVCVQIGASLDFLAGNVRRAPRWMQRTGLEWVYRMYRQPRRLVLRYARNFLFVMRMLLRDLALRARGRPRSELR